MRLVETSKFKKNRKKIKELHERKALKKAISHVIKNPRSGKQLKGQFKHLRSFHYSVKGQSRRLIYKEGEDSFVFLSFGPREGVYK